MKHRDWTDWTRIGFEVAKPSGSLEPCNGTSNSSFVWNCNVCFNPLKTGIQQRKQRCNKKGGLWWDDSRNQLGNGQFPRVHWRRFLKTQAAPTRMSHHVGCCLILDNHKKHSPPWDVFKTKNHPKPSTTIFLIKPSKTIHWVYYIIYIYHKTIQRLQELKKKKRKPPLVQKSPSFWGRKKA